MVKDHVINEAAKFHFKAALTLGITMAGISCAIFKAWVSFPEVLTLRKLEQRIFTYFYVVTSL